jgi:ribosomal protein S21
MIEIKIKDSNNVQEFDRAVKLLKKIINNEGILQEIQDRRYYSSPSEKKRLKQRNKHD